MSRRSDPIAASSGRPETLAPVEGARLGRLPLLADGSPALWNLRGDPEQLCLVVPDEATLLVRTDDHAEFTAGPREAVLLVGRVRFAAAARRAGRALVLTSPRAPIEALVGASCSSMTLRESVLLTATTRFLREVDGSAADEPADAPGGSARPRATALDRLLRELVVALLIDARAGAPAGPLWLGLFDRAIEYIAGHRTDQQLRTETLARALNVSERHLQRSFAAGGTTPQREIRRHRAALAAELLGDRAFAALSVDQIAHQSGFRNAADMRRALACHELPTPRALRSGGVALG